MAALSQILQILIDETLEQGKREKILRGGLAIHMRKDGGSLVLTIWRKLKPPSAQEWNVVIAHWPYLLGAVNWTQEGVTKSGKYFKQARLPIRETP